MASLIISKASVRLSPWLEQPGKAGQYTLYPPSDSWSNMTVNLWYWSGMSILR